MALDNAQFIAELSITDPPGTDPLSQGDDQIRTAKRAVFQSFEFIDAAVLLTAAQLNDVAIKGEANIFTQLATFSNAISSSIEGSILLSTGIPILGMRDTGQLLDEKVYDITAFNSELLIRTADDLGAGNVTAFSIRRTGTTVDAVNLHQGATSLRRLSTAGGGVVLVRGDGNTDTEAKSLALTHQDGTVRGSLGYGASADLLLSNDISSGNVTFFVRNAAAAQSLFLDSDPDGDTRLRAQTNLQLQQGGGQLGIQLIGAGATELYNAGVLRLSTAASGEVSLRGDGNTDAQVMRITFLHQNGTFRGFVGYSTSDPGGLQMTNDVVSGTIQINSTDAGSTVRQALFVDPDTITVLDGSNGVRLNTLANKSLGFFDTNGVIQQTITGSTGANSALTNLLIALDAMGLIVDNTTI